MNRGIRRYTPRVVLNHSRHKSVQGIFIEVVLFICLFGLIGHLTVNFWERYVIHNEITKLKSSLYSLQDTLNYIGNAYDNLHKEITVLAQITDHKIKPIEELNKNHNQDFNRRPINDFQVQTFVDRSDKKISAVKVNTIEQQTQKTNQPVCDVIKLVDFYRNTDSSIGSSNNVNMKVKNVSASASFSRGSVGVGSTAASVSCQSDEYRNSYQNKKIYSKPNDNKEKNNIYLSLSVPF